MAKLKTTDIEGILRALGGKNPIDWITVGLHDTKGKSPMTAALLDEVALETMGSGSGATMHITGVSPGIVFGSGGSGGSGSASTVHGASTVYGGGGSLPSLDGKTVPSYGSGITTTTKPISLPEISLTAEEMMARREEEVRREQRALRREEIHTRRKEVLFAAWRIAPDLVAEGGSDFARHLRSLNPEKLKATPDLIAGSKELSAEGMAELLHKVGWPVEFKKLWHTDKVDRINNLVRDWGADMPLTEYTALRIGLLDAVRAVVAKSADEKKAEAVELYSDPVELTPELVKSLQNEADRGFGTASVGVW